MDGGGAYDSSSISDQSSISVDDFFTREEDDFSAREDDVGPPESPSEISDGADPPLKLSLRRWKVTHPRVDMSACDDLLGILHPHHPELPLTTKTLVRTPRKTPTLHKLSPTDEGLYYHRGLETGIIHSLSQCRQEQFPQRLDIYLAVDGVSLTKSSTSQFWPIVGFIPSLPSSSPFEVAVYWGFTKPQNSNLFLKRTMEEADKLARDGLLWKGNRIFIFVKAFICDAPARAWVTCTKSHSSKLHGCSKCNGFGSNIGDLRTNLSFREKLDGLHHHGPTVIEILEYLDIIAALPLDPMHLLDLGIIKRMLEYLFKPSKTTSIRNVTLNPAAIRAFNADLEIIRSYISRFDFARKPPKDMKNLPRFKATEFRQFLHYTGVILFKKHLGSKFYRHFLLLHVAVRLLSFRPWCYESNSLAHELLTEFVKKAATLYTESFVCYNLHALLHLAMDVLIHGPLYEFSAYRFENFYGYLVKFLKKTDKPLHQLVRRLYERNELESQTVPIDNSIIFSGRHQRGPIVANCSGQQFDKAVKKNAWTLKANEPDYCVYLQDLSVIQVCNFVKHNGTNVVIGRKFLSKRNFYQFQFKNSRDKTVSVSSSKILEFLVSDPSPVLQAWDMQYIKCKAVMMDSFSTNTEVKSFLTSPLLMQ